MIHALPGYFLFALLGPSPMSCRVKVAYWMNDKVLLSDQDFKKGYLRNVKFGNTKNSSVFFCKICSNFFLIRLKQVKKMKKAFSRLRLGCVIEKCTISDILRQVLQFCQCLKIRMLIRKYNATLWVKELLHVVHFLFVGSPICRKGHKRKNFAFRSILQKEVH